MAILDQPYIPTTITVHLGPPDSQAENVTLSFPDYIKNVASSEIYPTWPEAALRANILAQISFALNRVYTEYYPSKGFDFNITSSTSIDQKFIKNRNIYQNISIIVDEIFNQYIRRIGFVEPLLAQFCNGTTSTCDGLSQWGSEELATEGYDYWGILEYYFGINIELVTDVPVQDIHESYPQPPLREGDSGEYVYLLQVMLNRVARAYPAIPTIWPETGVFDDLTDESVRAFQSAFNLNPDGIVGVATWYKLLSLYTGLKRLSELVSEGQTLTGSPFRDPEYFTIGTNSDDIGTLQYILNVLSEFNSSIDPVVIDGEFGPETRRAIIQLQEQFGLLPNGIVDPELWALMLDQYEGIRTGLFADADLFPSETIAQGTLSTDEVRALFDSLSVQSPEPLNGADPNQEMAATTAGGV